MPFRDNIQMLTRCLRLRCPRCGGGAIFEGPPDDPEPSRSSGGVNSPRMRLASWHRPVRECCAACELPLRRREPDTWLFMYVSMAFITGLYLIAMLWIFPAPSRPWLWRGFIGASAMSLYFITAPTRKALSIGMDYWVEERLKEP